MRRRLLALAPGLVALASFSAGPARAQVFDHLKCYAIAPGHGFITSPHAGDPLVLKPLQVPPLAMEDGCKLVGGPHARPRELCVPVDKTPRLPPNGQSLRNDYLCYRATCPPQPDIPNLGVIDQFVKGNVTVKRKTQTRRICVPAFKAVAVPPCGFDAAGVCGGTCASPLQICQTRFDPATNSDVCGCGPPTAPCSATSAPACGGVCQVVGQTCQPILGAATCGCQ